MQSSKAMTISGWVLTVLVGLFLIVASGIPKFSDFPGKEEMMEQMGIPLSILPTIAILEIAIAVLYLIPRTAFLGAILITGYLGGAIFTHVRVGEAWFFPVIIGVVMWVGLALRRPVLFDLLLGKRRESSAESEAS